MRNRMKSYASIDAYIAEYPKDVQVILKKLRQVIKKAAPQAEEAIRYGLPTFRLKGNLVHFGAFKTHIGFYPAPSGIGAFKKELEPYIGGKGTIQFSFDQPIPYDLVEKVVKFRVQEHLKKMRGKE